MFYFFDSAPDELRKSEEDTFYMEDSADNFNGMILSNPVIEEQAFFTRRMVRSHAFEPVIQLGAHCKLAAVANVERYFAMQMNFAPIPLYKREGAQNSIRQIGKSFGSSQGEVLEFKTWSEIFDVLGYQNTAYGFSSNDYGAFLVIIDCELKQGNLPVIAFPVIKETDDVEQIGQPNLRPNPSEEIEHAAVIMGCDIAQETLKLVHWGRDYIVSAQELFIANQQLAETRSVEYYSQTPDAHIRHGRSDKYVPLFDKFITPAKTSITPSPLSGFKGKLLIAQKPLDLELLNAQRFSLLESLNRSEPEPAAAPSFS
jgi:hypothetical protein